jgi:beta-galactosidase
MRVPGIPYGADYNPEQWEPRYIDDDIERMREAGVTVVTLGVFSWATLEPRPGEFDLGWMRAVMDRLHAAGIGVDLATATASPPPWMGALYPETLPTTADGTRLSWGSRQQYNPSSRVFRERVAVLVSRLAEEFADHPALIAWHVGNEYGGHVAESFDDESAEHFRTWLGIKYENLASLNLAWGTAFWSQRYSTWSEVSPPRAMPTIPNPHQLDDWREYCSDTLLELYLLERDILRSANPDVPITTNYMGLFRPLDYWKWSEHLDFISNDSYPDPANPRAAREFAFDCDLMRSLARGKPFVQMEQVTTAVQWRPRNATKRPGQYALWSLSAVARGADGILNFQWRQSLAGAETFHGAMVPHAGADSATWQEVVELGATLAQLAPVRDEPVHADTAILWDWRNAWAQQNAVGPTDEAAPENGARAWHASLFELGHVVDFAHPEHDLTGYRVIVVPALFRLTDAAADRIEQARQSGSQVIVTYLTGYVDEQGHVREGGYLGPLANTVGVRVVDISPRAVTAFVPGHVEPLADDVDSVSAAVGTPGAEAGIAVRSDDTMWAGSGLTWAERVRRAPDTRVHATFAVADVQGLPAVTTREHAAGGHAWYIATDLDARGRRAVLVSALTAAGIPSSGALPMGVERITRGAYEFTFNHSDSPVSVISSDGASVEIPPRASRIRRLA